MRAALPGAFVRQLDASAIAATDAPSAVIGAVRTVLAGGPRPRGETATAVTRALPPALTPPCRGRCPDPHVGDSLFRLAGVSGAMSFVKDHDILMAIDPDPAPSAGRPEARAELVRRYLRSYGPSKPEAFSEWAGISLADARQSLTALGDAVVEVTLDGGKGGVMLRADLGRAARARASGVRFLPPFDAYLLDRDRATLVPERAAQKVVWRVSGNPGLVLVDGEPTAAWKTRQQGKRLGLTVQPLRASPPLDPADLQDEAERVASVLGKQGPVEVTISSPP